MHKKKPQVSLKVLVGLAESIPHPEIRTCGLPDLQSGRYNQAFYEDE